MSESQLVPHYRYRTTYVDDDGLRQWTANRQLLGDQVPEVIKSVFRALPDVASVTITNREGRLSTYGAPRRRRVRPEPTEGGAC